MTQRIPPSRLRRRARAQKSPKSAQTVETTVTFLEMVAQPLHHRPAPINLRIALVQAHQIPVHYYRYLYNTVGGAYNWIDRRVLSDDALAQLINRPAVTIFVAYLDGCPAGFFELDMADPQTVWIEYFGIISDYYGLGLGKWLLSEAISTAWSTNPKTVRVETCTLDDPRALPLYQKFGFVPYKRLDKTMPLLDLVKS